MRFLCLHGKGTNSQILEAQTSAIRHELGQHYEFEFLDARFECEAAVGTEDIASSDDSFLSWIDERSPENTLDALNEFETYINEAGPFDGLIAFSQAAGFAASFIIRTLREREPVDTLVAPPFRCAIFFCAAPLEGESAFGKYLDPVVDKHRIAMPTAHIWGKNDRQVQKSGSWLVELCVKDGTEVFIHEEGHEIPGTRKPEALRGALRAIRKTIEKATFAC